MSAFEGRAPLGVFDSGLGGLTVVRALRERLPHERILYLGDTARVPYGTKGQATVTRYALACVRHLKRHGAKAVVVACNTVSAVAPDRLRAEFDLPILGVIEPGARAAVTVSKSARIGVLATAATTASGAYARAVAQISTRAEVFSQAAPLLVPLAEEGWLEGDVPRLAARRYLEPFVRKNIDTLVLGCTHYPLLRGVLEAEARELLGEGVVVVDSAEATADAVAQFLRERAMEGHETGDLRVHLTDVPGTFSDVGTRFLGSRLDAVEQVDL
jgi:glutamate racemase